MNGCSNNCELWASRIAVQKKKIFSSVDKSNEGHNLLQILKI